MTGVFLVPVGGYNTPAISLWPEWKTERYDVRLLINNRIVRFESFATFETAERYSKFMEQGLLP